MVLVDLVNQRTVNSPDMPRFPYQSLWLMAFVMSDARRGLLTLHEDVTDKKQERMT
jgi:hypothetical protein